MARRIIKATDASDAGLEVTENGVRLSGHRNTFLQADEDGMYLVGALSILTEPQNIRVGAGFVFPTAYEAVLPSTAVNPQPILIADPPVQGYASVAEEVARLLEELV